MVETEDGLVDDGTAETEVKFRLPRGSDPGPEGVPKDIPIVTGAVGAEATPTRAPKRNGPHMNCPPHQSRDQAGRCREPGHSRQPTSSHSTGRHIQHWVGRCRVPGHSW